MYPQPQPYSVKKPTNPWMIIGWIFLGMFVLCGGGCVAIFGITALGSAVDTTTTTRVTTTTTTSSTLLMPT